MDDAQAAKGPQQTAAFAQEWLGLLGMKDVEERGVVCGGVCQACVVLDKIAHLAEDICQAGLPGFRADDRHHVRLDVEGVDKSAHQTSATMLNVP